MGIKLKLFAYAASLAIVSAAPTRCAETPAQLEANATRAFDNVMEDPTLSGARLFRQVVDAIAGSRAEYEILLQQIRGVSSASVTVGEILGARVTLSDRVAPLFGDAPLEVWSRFQHNPILAQLRRATELIRNPDEYANSEVGMIEKRLAIAVAACIVARSGAVPTIVVEVGTDTDLIAMRRGDDHTIYMAFVNWGRAGDNYYAVTHMGMAPDDLLPQGVEDRMENLMRRMGVESEQALPPSTRIAIQRTREAAARVAGISRRGEATWGASVELLQESGIVPRAIGETASPMVRLVRHTG
jgi:hypothetical protein